MKNPTLNPDGTPFRDLFNRIDLARAACRRFYDAFVLLMPLPQDYGNDDELYNTAMIEFIDRLNTVDGLLIELQEMAEAVVEQQSQDRSVGDEVEPEGRELHATSSRIVH